MGDGRGPLAGVKVVEMVGLGPGPFAGMMLADMGADVLAIDRPGGVSISLSHDICRRGKRVVELDVKTQAGRKAALEEIAGADGLIEGNRPGVMERLGYGWDDLHAQFPRLIYGAVSGFGHTGPEAKRPAYDMVVQARGGVMSITGEKGREPVRVGASIGISWRGCIWVREYWQPFTTLNAAARAGKSTCRCWIPNSPFSNTPWP